MTQVLNAQHGAQIVQTRAAIRNREEFKTHGSLAGRPWTAGAGQLHGAELDRYCADVNGIDYVVFSYSTPIAWHTPNGWYTVGQKFSQTTSRHQTQVMLALTTDL